MKYENACEFYNKADYEGGVAELVLGYGVSSNDVPPEVGDAISDLKEAYDELEKQLKKWHGHSCVSLDPEERCSYG